MSKSSPVLHGIKLATKSSINNAKVKSKSMPVIEDVKPVEVIEESAPVVETVQIVEEPTPVVETVQIVEESTPVEVIAEDIQPAVEETIHTIEETVKQEFENVSMAVQSIASTSQFDFSHLKNPFA